jgi:hypothetical protein
MLDDKNKNVKRKKEATGEWGLRGGWGEQAGKRMSNEQ